MVPAAGDNLGVIMAVALHRQDMFQGFSMPPVSTSRGRTRPPMGCMLLPLPNPTLSPSGIPPSRLGTCHHHPAGTALQGTQASVVGRQAVAALPSDPDTKDDKRAAVRSGWARRQCLCHGDVVVTTPAHLNPTWHACQPWASRPPTPCCHPCSQRVSHLRATGGGRPRGLLPARRLTLSAL